MTPLEDELVDMLLAMPNPSDAEVYIAVTVSSPRYVKIGISCEVDKRIDQLNTASPFRVWCMTTFPGGRGIEALLHARFADRRTNGEWFRWDDQMWHVLYWFGHLLRVRHPDWGTRGFRANCLANPCESCAEEREARGLSLPQDLKPKDDPPVRLVTTFDPDDESEVGAS